MEFGNQPIGLNDKGIAADGQENYSIGRMQNINIIDTLNLFFDKNQVLKVMQECKEEFEKKGEVFRENYASEILASRSASSKATQSRIILEDYSEKAIVTDIYRALIKIQRNKLFWDQEENVINTELRDLLPDKYEKRDQTLSGISAGTGSKKRRAGSLDLELWDREGNPLAIVEALWINRLNRENIKVHIDKELDNYNPNGLPYIFLVMYCKVEDFGNLWSDILSLLEEYEFKTPVYSEKGQTGKNKMRSYKIKNTTSNHVALMLERNNKPFSLHVLAIQMHEKV